jgi:hypothetical protein
VAGIECHLGTALVDRVGVYRFASFTGEGSGSALDAYLTRLADAGVAPRSGDCQAGTAGDRSWPAYLDDDADGSPGFRAERSGCFLDQNRIANVRLTCYDDIYVGVLGRNSDVAGLYKWAWQIASGESVHRDPPGICASPD